MIGQRLTAFKICQSVNTFPCLGRFEALPSIDAASCESGIARCLGTTLQNLSFTFLRMCTGANGAELSAYAVAHLEGHSTNAVSRLLRRRGRKSIDATKTTRVSEVHQSAVEQNSEVVWLYPDKHPGLALSG